MRCERCNGLCIHEDFRSVDNDYGRVSYMRCVNCGFYQFARHADARVNPDIVHQLPIAA